ncbi:cache domain-containing sensor histidine kinase [Massiliimalia massiliensis]|uniref:cache domain-containing sensor histidine kinase n=1 Tax=Massiliimalia massiliensis TaxID=1852384 RepID=UPI00098735A1|nr:histidine kinase [Massiliimalia massiliensis]
MRPFSRFKITLRWYLTLGVTSLIILSVATFLIFPTRKYLSLFEQQTQGYANNIANQIAANIADTLTEIDFKTTNLIKEPLIWNFLKRDLSDKEAKQQFEMIISQYFSSTDYYYIDSIEIYGKEDSRFYSYGKLKSKIDNPFSSAEYKQAINYPLQLCWLGYNQKLDCLDTVRLIYDTNTYQVTGFIVLRFSPNYLYDKVYTSSKEEKFDISNLIIVSEQNTILGAKNSSLLGTLLPNYSIEKLEKSSGLYQYKNKVISYHFLKDKITKYPYRNWVVQVEIERDVLYKEINQIIYFSYFIAFLIVLLGIWGARLGSFVVTKPIVNLVFGMKQVQEGNLKTQWTTKSRIIEISFLGQSFNQMSRNLDELIAKEYQEQLLLKDLQLENLQAQINPHFLFNTLQLISWTASQYEAEDVCNMIYSLSYMLEKDLERKGDHVSCLEDERTYIQHYAYIIDNKYQGRIHIDCHFPQELLQAKIPKLILQPFIENSIVHGLSGQTKSGIVDISAVQEQKNLIITIKDNGVGMGTEQIEQVSSAEESKGHHIALQNIQHRIKILYGEKYGFTINSQPFHGTVVTIKIPLEIMQGEEKNDEDIDYRR